jgi:hypothetical protein
LLLHIDTTTWKTFRLAILIVVILIVSDTHIGFTAANGRASPPGSVAKRLSEQPVVIAVVRIPVT